MKIRQDYFLPTPYGLWERENPVLFKRGQLVVRPFFDFPRPPTPELSLLVDFLIKQASIGSPMVPVHSIRAIFHVSEEAFKNIFALAENLSLIQVTKRRFGESLPFVFCSLLVKEVSLEILYWVLITIKNDKMLPSDKLVQSRLKEYFGCPLSPENFSMFLQSLMENSNPNGLPQCIGAWVSMFRVVEAQNRFNFVKSAIQEELNPEKSAGNSSTFPIKFLVWLSEGTWVAEDMNEELLPEQLVLWSQFLKFIDAFFFENEEESSTMDTLSPEHEPIERLRLERKLGGKSWLSSVDSQHSKASEKNSNMLKKGLEQRKIKKAIPGGKYGCCQLLKLMGPIIFRDQPIGVLAKIVQKALTEKRLLYFKTLLIKNSAFDKSQTKSQSESEQARKEAKLLILECLRCHPRGVIMSQLHAHLRDEFKYKLDFNKLGIIKLKTFIKEIDEVEMRKEGSNLIKVILREEPKKIRMAEKRASWTSVESQIIEGLSPNTREEAKGKSEPSQAKVRMPSGSIWGNETESPTYRIVNKAEKETKKGENYYKNHSYQEMPLVVSPESEKSKLQGKSSKQSQDAEEGFLDAEEQDYEIRIRGKRSCSDAKTYLKNVDRVVSQFIQSKLVSERQALHICDLSAFLEEKLGHRFIPASFNFKNLTDYLVSRFPQKLHVQPHKSYEPMNRISSVQWWPDLNDSPFLYELASDPKESTRDGETTQTQSTKINLKVQMGSGKKEMEEIASNKTEPEHYWEDLEPLEDADEMRGRSRSSKTATEKEKKVVNGWEGPILDQCKRMAECILPEEEEDQRAPF